MTRIVKLMAAGFVGQRNPVCRPWVLFLLFSLAGTRAWPVEYTVTPVSDENYVSHDPVISDTGLAAWSSFPKLKPGDTSSDIIVLLNGKALSITQNKPVPNIANIRPQIQSNSVVWISTLGNAMPPYDWVLREVSSPERDTPVPELPASYVAHENSQGFQIWEPTKATMMEDQTNAPATGSTTGAMEAAATAAKAKMAKPEMLFDTNAPTDGARRGLGDDNEVCLWDGGHDYQRITRDRKNDFGANIWGKLIAWQKEKAWPFGWEIMVWDDGARYQLTTNYYYDMEPKVQADDVVWYGWDGHDFEIYLWNAKSNMQWQITNNAFDDVTPVVWNHTIAWEAYAGADADIFMWSDNRISKLSDNIEDDQNPRIWQDKVVWQGFDGDDFEIYYFDGTKSVKLTSNTYDDLNPEIRDGLVCWMGYVDNWDAEIFVWDGKDIVRLTDNDVEDRDPKTAGGRVIWQSDQNENSIVYLAEPKK